jgi:glucose/arabinose dehydrogenase
VARAAARAEAGDAAVSARRRAVAAVVVGRVAAGAALVAALALPGSASAATPVLAQIGTFDQPVHLSAPPRDTSRVFVVEQRGTVRLLVDGALQGRPFLDLTASVSTGFERGLLSIAFAPDYATSGTFYVYYTGRPPATLAVGDVQIDEYRRSATDPHVADPASRRSVLTIAHPLFDNHNGGTVAFGPDGMLWAATGDGGGAGDPAGNAQNPASRLGKLLRIDPRPGGAAETWASGLRNPFRFSFDRATGDLAIGDVGQNFVEEIDFVTNAGGLGRGANFGWDRVEGHYRYSDLNPTALQPAGPGDFPAGYVGPVIEHLRADGWVSIIGGHVVRDPALPELAGRYVYGDWGKGELWAATLGPGGATGDGPTGLRVPSLSSLGEDGCGRLYALSLDGPVYRVSTTGACAGPAGTPVPDVPALTVRAAGRQRALRKGFIAIAARCRDQCRIRTGGPILVSRSPARGTAAPARVPVVRSTLAAGATVPLRLKLSRRVRAKLTRALRRPRRRVTAVVTVTAAMPGRPGARRTVRVRIVR